MFTKVISLDDLWSGEMLGVRVADKRVLLVRLGEEVHAYEDRCAHRGVPLSEGALAGNVLTCSAHHWEYDVCAGTGVNPRGAELRRFPVRVERGDVFVDVEASQSSDDDRVGPVLTRGSAADAVVAAIREGNLEVSVRDAGGYVRVLACSPCVVSRAAIEAHLGRPFRLPQDLEPIMPSFQGKLALHDERVEWSAARRGRRTP